MYSDLKAPCHTVLERHTVVIRISTDIHQSAENVRLDPGLIGQFSIHGNGVFGIYRIIYIALSLPRRRYP